MDTGQLALHVQTNSTVAMRTTQKKKKRGDFFLHSTTVLLLQPHPYIGAIHVTMMWLLLLLINLVSCQ